MFRSVFNKIGKAAYNTAKNQSGRQNMIKSSMPNMKLTQQSLKLSASFSTTMMYQQMYKYDYLFRECVSLLQRTTPLGNAVALNIQNLREML